MTDHSYRFADGLVSPVLDDEKTATVRVDDDRDVHMDDLVSLQTERGSQFGKGRVRGIARVPAVQALQAIQMFDAKYGADSVEELLDQLRSHYPDHPVGNTTPVHVVVFEVIDDVT